MGRNGKSRALICFVLCMIMALPVYFSSAVAVKAAEQQTIIIGTNAEYSPFEYLDDDGNITGFDYDLLEAIAKEENVKLVWKDMPFDSLMGSMEAGDVQVIAAGIGPTEDRKKSVDFSDVYYTGTQCIISRKDNPIKDFEEMSGKTVAVLEGAQSDMIASGESMLDTAKELKERKAEKVVVCCTFGLFTAGFDKFDEFYQKGYIDSVVTTNLNYRSPELFTKEWYVEADMSKYIAAIINSLNHDVSIGNSLSPTDKIQKLIRKYNEGLL